MRIIEFLSEKARKDATGTIHRLQDLLTRYPECRELLTQLLTEPDSVIEGAFGEDVRCGETSVGYFPNTYVLQNYLDWCAQFISHEILDDGSPGIAFCARVNPHFREICEKNAELHTQNSTLLSVYEKVGKSPPLLAVEPFICRNWDWSVLPDTTYATFDRVVEVIKHYHQKEKEQREKAIERHKARMPEYPLFCPTEEEIQRQGLAKDLGLTWVNDLPSYTP